MFFAGLFFLFLRSFSDDYGLEDFMRLRYELKKSTSQTEKAVMKHVEKTKRKLEELKPSLEEEFKVKSIGIFGSYIRGEEKKESDLDILVDFEESADLSLLGFVRLENRLSDELGVKVDLVEKGTLKPRIGKRVLEEVVDDWQSVRAASSFANHDGAADFVLWLVARD